MSARMVSARVSSPVRLATAPSLPPIDTAPQQNDEFAKWWGQWVTRIQQARPIPGRRTLVPGKPQTGVSLRLAWLLAMAACRKALVSVLPRTRIRYHNGQ